MAIKSFASRLGTAVARGAGALAAVSLLAACGPSTSTDAGAPGGSASAPSALGVDPSLRYPDDSTPLMWAVYDGDAEAVATLIDAGADVNASNRYGANALQLAAETADLEMLTMLLNAGADVDSPNPEGQTALMLVARTGNVDAARLLVERGAAVDAREAWGEQTALMWAVARRHPEMAQYLIEQGADVNARSKTRDYQRHVTAEPRAKNLDRGGLTPLLYAARENCLDCARLLIAHGTDVDTPDPGRVSPLLLAVLNENWDVARLLIDAGADVDQWDIYGLSPLFVAAGAAQSRERTSIDPLTEATGVEVMALLLEAGADPNLQLFMRPADRSGAGVSRGFTPLHAAAAAGDLAAVQLLLAHGADAALNDADNETVLMAAIQGRGRLGGIGPSADPETTIAILRALEEEGADVDANALFYHLSRARGGTALHYAVRAGADYAVDELVAMGADVNIKDPDGLTALDYAMARGFLGFLEVRRPPQLELAEKLRSYGANVELEAAPVWPPWVGPPTYYNATIWPLDPTVPSRSYETMEPSPFLAEAIAGLQYTGTPQPEPEYDEASLFNGSTTSQVSLDGDQVLR